MKIQFITEADYPQIANIYLEGIQSGHATFETKIPDWNFWDQSHLNHSRLVVLENEQILAWAALSPVSGRCVYGGVAEVSVYVKASEKGRGIGSSLLMKLIEESEQNGIWTLQAGIFPENKASLKIHQNCGFRLIGTRQSIGEMKGQWRDVCLLERRSTKVGTTKLNLLILCTGNSCRSQIAEAYFRFFTKGKINVYSAGIESHGLNKHAVQTMLEDGIDISNQTSNIVEEYLHIPFDYVITVCDHAKESCPVFLGNAKRFHQSFPDPAKFIGTNEEIKFEFRKVRELIKYYCHNFVKEHDLLKDILPI